MLSQKSSARVKLDQHLIEGVTKLQAVSSHLVPGNYTAVTQDHSDHTFNGIMFGLEAKRVLPCEFVEVQSFALKGELGPVSIYARRYPIENAEWQLLFGPKVVHGSFASLVEVCLDIPLRLAPGMKTTIYIHSQLPTDTALVYDNQRKDGSTYEDNVIRIHPGVAHTSNIPFSPVNHWGGNAWRRGREFVGTVRYGVKLVLWTPSTHPLFPTFHQPVITMLCLHNTLGQRAGINFGKLPKDVVFKILNYLPWDSFGDQINLGHSDKRLLSRNSSDSLVPGNRFNRLMDHRLAYVLFVICLAIMIDQLVECRSICTYMKKVLSK